MLKTDHEEFWRQKTAGIETKAGSLLERGIDLSVPKGGQAGKPKL